jgi:N-ethylmaleimide reductase
MPTLFDPIRIGPLTAPNRIFMAPLTRGRATREHVPTERMARYYSQRASAGLIITEATGISRQGLGWPYAPGLWTDEQRDGWKPVTSAVHVAGGRIFAQLWHMGRVVHPDYLDGAPPVSASATTAPNRAHTYDGKKPYAEARALDVSELPGIVNDYVRAAKNAREAGFDGVQIHSANGYLIDQFLRDGSNKRTDAYGGSIENRIRFLREVVEAVVGEVGAERTAVRFSPNGETQGVDDSHPETLFPTAAKMLQGLGIAFLELREPGNDGSFGKTDVPKVSPRIREVFTNPLVLNSDYTKETAEAALASGVADAITFGRPFLANPDLPARLAKGVALNTDDMPTWYSQGDEGYVDYPTAE